MKRILAALICVAALAWAGCGGGGGDGDDGNNTAGDRCGGTCSTGQYCWNGICVNGCTSNENCDANSYCEVDPITKDGACVLKEVPGCAKDADCADTQVCMKGACGVVNVEVVDCEWQPNGEDGCASDELCIEQAAKEGEDPVGECYSFPPCGEGGKCPVGTTGAVCNVKADKQILTSKGAICLMGVCEAVGDCPANWKCIRKEVDPVGLCSSGEMGYPCYSNDDCGGGNTCSAMGWMMGVCMPGTGGCTKNEDCGDGMKCEMGMCIPDMGM